MPPRYAIPKSHNSDIVRHAKTFSQPETPPLSQPPSPSPADAKKQLRRVMGFWDVLLFNIVTVLGPRWIAAAAHNGSSSISLWVLAASVFFVPTTLVITELSTRFPSEGGLYAWSKEAFGDFHGFVAGWTYWVYTFFYFPGLLLASAAMAAYIGGSGFRAGAEPHVFDGRVVRAVCFVAVVNEHHRPEYRQVAAERRRRGHLSAVDDSGGRRGNRVVAPRFADRLHVAQYLAAVESGHR
jgi:hypothetical protein